MQRLCALGAVGRAVGRIANFCQGGVQCLTGNNALDDLGECAG